MNFALLLLKKRKTVKNMLRAFIVSMEIICTGTTQSADIWLQQSFPFFISYCYSFLIPSLF